MNQKFSLCRRVISSLAATLLATSALTQTNAQTPLDQSHRPPNVIVILADDLGYADTSADPGARFSTPNIERLAREGVRFADGYASAPVCAPSRAGLLTGRYQERFGFQYNDGGSRRALSEGLGLPLGQVTIAQVLKADGYYTAMIGKWHEGEQPKFYPTNRGFDEFVGFLPGETNYIDPTLPGVHLAFRGIPEPDLHDLVEGKPLQIDPDRLQAMVGSTKITDDDAGDDEQSASEQNIQRAGQRLASSFKRRGPNQIVTGPDHEVVDNQTEYLTDYFADKAAAFVDKNAHTAKPYFLYLAFNAPHAPLMVTQKYFDRFANIKDHQLRVYAAMISALDDGVGKVLDAVQRSGEADNTIVIFASDNGCAEYSPGLCTNTPLRGGKLSFYEGGVRVPFLMSWPGHLKAGSVYDKPVSLMDILPTAVGAAGGTLPTDRAYDGVNLIPYLTDEKGGAPHSFLAWQTKPLVAIRAGDWKLWETEESGHDVYGNYKLLFNLHDDLNESVNLEKQDPEKVKTLEKMIHDWEAPMISPLWQTKGPVTITIDGMTFKLPV